VPGTFRCAGGHGCVRREAEAAVSGQVRVGGGLQPPLPLSPGDDHIYGEAAAGFPHPGPRTGLLARRPNRPWRHNPRPQP
jgi:hypothetical protein